MRATTPPGWVRSTRHSNAGLFAEVKMKSEHMRKRDADKLRAKSPAEVVGAALFLVATRALFIANIMIISKT